MLFGLSYGIRDTYEIDYTYALLHQSKKDTHACAYR